MKDKLNKILILLAFVLSIISLAIFFGNSTGFAVEGVTGSPVLGVGAFLLVILVLILLVRNLVAK